MITRELIPLRVWIILRQPTYTWEVLLESENHLEWGGREGEWRVCVTASASTVAALEFIPLILFLNISPGILNPESWRIWLGKINLISTVDVSNTRGGLLKDTAVPCLAHFTGLAHPPPHTIKHRLISLSPLSGELFSVDKSSFTQNIMPIPLSGGSPQPMPALMWSKRLALLLDVGQLYRAACVPETRPPGSHRWEHD